MNMQSHHFKSLSCTLQPLALVLFACLLLVACASKMVKPEGADSVRNKLLQLQSNAELASHAPLEIKEAELAVRAAEQPREDADLARHLIVIAERKVDIAWARAQSRLLEDQRELLSEERENTRLEARTREADLARREANAARNDVDLARREADAARNDVDLARREANAARSDVDLARSQAEVARIEAEAARQQAETARMEAELIRQQAENLQQEIEELNAKTTDRGLVVTLGDVLFETGKAELKGGATSNLEKLATFLNQYQDRTVIIEGHTDNIGSENFNLGLSQRRANAVTTFLITYGIDNGRITTLGKGEGSPVASNQSATGRQQNRRVEVIISNNTAVPRR